MPKRSNIFFNCSQCQAWSLCVASPLGQHSVRMLSWRWPATQFVNLGMLELHGLLMCTAIRKSRNHQVSHISRILKSRASEIEHSIDDIWWCLPWSPVMISGCLSGFKCQRREFEWAHLHPILHGGRSFWEARRRVTVGRWDSTTRRSRSRCGDGHPRNIPFIDRGYMGLPLVN